MAVAMFHVEHMLPLAPMRAVEGARWRGCGHSRPRPDKSMVIGKVPVLSPTCRESYGRVQQSAASHWAARRSETWSVAGTGDREHPGFSLARSPVSAAGAPAPGNAAVMPRSPITGQSRTAAWRQTFASSPDTRTPESIPRRQLGKYDLLRRRLGGSLRACAESVTGACSVSALSH